MKEDKSIKRYGIEALPKHKEICGYLIDNQITFHCYNGGLKMIEIERHQHYMTDDFIQKLADEFGLKKSKKGKDIVYLNES